VRAEYTQHLTQLARRAAALWKTSVGWCLDVFPSPSFPSSSASSRGSGGLEDFLASSLVGAILDDNSASDLNANANFNVNAIGNETTATMLMILAMSTYLDTESGYGGLVHDERSREWASLGEALTSISDQMVDYPSDYATSLVNGNGNVMEQRMNELDRDVERVRSLVRVLL
jgi:hypothetical protein